MSSFRPKSVIVRPAERATGSVGHNSQDSDAATEDIGCREFAKSYSPYAYNTYGQVHRQSFVARRSSSNGSSPVRDAADHYKSRSTDDTVPSATPPACSNGPPLTARNRRQPRGLSMLVLPKSGQSIGSFTVDGFHRAACDVVGRGMISSRLTARGGLLVEVSSSSSARRLLKTETLCGISVDVLVPRSDQQNLGLIRDVTKWYTDEEVADRLSSQGVVQARRIKARARDGDVAASRDNAQPTDKVVLVFMPHEERPRYVILDAVEREVEEYRPEIPQCFECCRVGHIAKYCPFNVRCARCGGPHRSLLCDQRIRCPNCGQAHRANSRFCPAHQGRFYWQTSSTTTTAGDNHRVSSLHSVVQLPDKNRETDAVKE
ncbi:hypothetical protein HPB50_006164 [Hyalomma asiaticum]|uniref:Uncharacterized protein n=1 Tax=Hyalomma asiaticum TaxID=266040 RepID=A0ACB7RYB6_HYAAI|nr:hypothetical protein HPB50_006164 [Hyalomma asiaticum]